MDIESIIDADEVKNADTAEDALRSFIDIAVEEARFEYRDSSTTMMTLEWMAENTKIASRRAKIL
jgi:hypothetical protein